MPPYSSGPPPPPKKNRLPPQGGSGIPPIMKKNHFFHFLPFFACFTTSSFKTDSGKMKMDFKNPREVFSQHGMKNKNLSQFFQGATSRENRSHLRGPFFQIFGFSVTVPILQELLRPAGDEFGETEGGFCPEHAHIQ
jgi:hypothetical protein